MNSHIREGLTYQTFVALTDWKDVPVCAALLRAYRPQEVKDDINQKYASFFAPAG
jgi:hypothetical protein